MSTIASPLVVGGVRQSGAPVRTQNGMKRNLNVKCVCPMNNLIDKFNFTLSFLSDLQSLNFLFRRF